MSRPAPGRQRTEYAMEDQVREAVLVELRRQSEADPSTLRVSVEVDRLELEGTVDPAALTAAVVAAIAGSP